MKTIIHALKEWAIAVEALTQGKTILLIRKGGIKEENNRFEVAHRQILLYPTYEHQKPQLLKPEYRDRVTIVNSGWHPQTVSMQSWANITDILQVSEVQTLTQLQPYHIWNETFAGDRFKWKPKQPLYILLLRVYQLPETINLPYREEYGGCRSWIDLERAISTEGSIPVMGDRDYQAKVQTLRDLVRVQP
ncbi:MAG: DUF1802 family protein [Jaaginema sp. PMC 1080.18]|nr:DUF1802 family protein [Jaaginema sp. PMC 1080.18]MEC4865225.1 DUF1802 family protein [Jaaginema sp. PMC 1078.18]